ncbi:MAG TPA: STM3941 family protein [Mucilaginibacter sp.]|nr:STM3941 family protein [Mucilaginibacter sp.]
MEPEEFAFSPLQPILFVMASPAYYYMFFSGKYDWFFILTHNWFVWVFALPFILFTWKQTRPTLLMLLRKPAVILTDKGITITERNYTIYWEDIMDVYMAHQGGGSYRANTMNQYVIIRVREPEKYIKAIKNPFTRYVRWYTRNLFNLSPFEVSLFLVRGDDDEIYHTILNYYQHNRLYFRIPYTPE